MYAFTGIPKNKLYQYYTIGTAKIPNYTAFNAVYVKSLVQDWAFACFLGA